MASWLVSGKERVAGQLYAAVGCGWLPLVALVLGQGTNARAVEVSLARGQRLMRQTVDDVAC